MKGRPTQRLTIEQYLEGLLKGDTSTLSQAITLVESRLEMDEDLASKLLEKIQPLTGSSIRIGITGVPGVGKSTFIEALGQYITSRNKKLAVLAVDPTSPVNKGSILGDKTRMEQLSKLPNAFIRPSPAGTAMGGVASKTREAILVCEAAGFDVIIVETVGAGQSDVVVRGMVDFFLLLMLAGAGDELQGIKKGIVEMADLLLITKADGDNEKKAVQAQREYQQALHLVVPRENDWKTKVMTCSSLESKGISECWEAILQFEKTSKANGFFDTVRQQQNASWLRENMNSFIQSVLLKNPRFSKKWKEAEQKVISRKWAVPHAVRVLKKEWKDVSGL